MADFLIQKLHPALVLGYRPRIAASGALAFSAQGDWASSCILHASDTAMALLGYIADPAGLRWETKGIAARFWNLAEPLYHTGATLDELIDMLARMNLGLRTRLIEAPHAAVLEFCKRELARGELVILSYRQRGLPFRHAVLVVGVEGMVRGRLFTVHALLILDSAEKPPRLTAYNARLTCDTTKRFASYVTSDGEDGYAVVLTGAISIRPAIKRARTDKPP